MRRALLSVVAAAVLAFGVSAAAAAARGETARSIDIPAWFKPSFLDFRHEVAEAAKTGKRVAVYFGQDGCPYCRELMRTNFTQKEIADKARTHFDFIAVNIWGDTEVVWTDRTRYTEKTFAAMLKVQFTPTLLFLDERGVVVLRLNGYYPPHRFAAALDYVAGRHESRTAFADYLAANTREPASGKLHRQPFFLKPPFDLSRVRRSGRPLAVLFEQAACAACDELHRVGFRDAGVRQAREAIDIVRLELFGREAVVTPAGESLDAARWGRALGVAYTPTIVFFDASAKEVFRVEGYVRAFHLAASFDYVASGAYRKQPSFQRYVQQRAERIRAAGGRVQLW